MDENIENIEATENAEDINIAAKALEDIKGHDKIVIEDEETGTEYTCATPARWSRTWRRRASRRSTPPKCSLTAP